MVSPSSVLNASSLTLIPNNKHRNIPLNSIRQQYNQLHPTVSHVIRKSDTSIRNGGPEIFQSSSMSSGFKKVITFQKSLISLTAAAVVLWSSPADAGILSGLSGIESVPGPELPQIDFLKRFNEENQKMYAENDARFKESPILKQLLERSRQNKEKNKQEILDKYCLRGAEWGVGDCSAEGMTPEERDKFIAMLKQRAGITE